MSRRVAGLNSLHTQTAVPFLMPTYEYRCTTCEERFEVWQSFTTKPLRTHDVCGGPVQKVFHASGVVFKGSGYYVTDSRSNGSGSDAKSKDPDKTKTDNADKTDKSDKSDKKPAKDTEKAKGKSEPVPTPSAAAAD